MISVTSKFGPLPFAADKNINKLNNNKLVHLNNDFSFYIIFTSQLW